MVFTNSKIKICRFIIEQFYSKHEYQSLNKIEIAIRSENSDDLNRLPTKGYITNINTIFPQLNHRSVLMMTCEAGNLDCVKVLLQNHANVNARTDTGGCALISACLSGNYELFNYLIANGTDLDDSLIFDCYQTLVYVNVRFSDKLEIAKTVILCKKHQFH